MTTVFLHGCILRKDGTSDSFWTKEVESKIKPMAHHKAGLSWTASGYGNAIPSQMMVRFNGRWRRVYVRQFSNAGTAYIRTEKTESITVQEA